MSDESEKRTAIVERFGDYVVEKRLAMGGMAEIFLARHVGIEDFEKRVVLKRIRPELAVEPRFVRMFLNEARLAATLQHHHIAQVYDIGEDNGEFFFAMEYLDGVDARTILRWGMTEQPIPEKIALSIALAVASGLHHAHEACDASGSLLGIVHRDISPSNVFVTYEGSIKLMDFGIAKAQFQEGRTGSGTLKGKAPYMSPEQIRGDSVDLRSDIFSLGVVLFELVTSSRLFRGKTEFQIFRQIVSGKTPNIRNLAPGMRPGLAAIISKALARKPEKRFKSAQAFQRALDELVSTEGLRASDFEIADYVQTHFGDKERVELRAHQLESIRPNLNRPTLRRQGASRWLLAAAAVAVIGAGAWVGYDRLIRAGPTDRVVPAAAETIEFAPTTASVDTTETAPPAAQPLNVATPVTAREDVSEDVSKDVASNSPAEPAKPARRKRKRRAKAPITKKAVAEKPLAAAAATPANVGKKKPAKWDPSSPLPPPKRTGNE